MSESNRRPIHYEKSTLRRGWLWQLVTWATTANIGGALLVAQGAAWTIALLLIVALGVWEAGAPTVANDWLMRARQRGGRAWVTWLVLSTLVAATSFIGAGLALGIILQRTFAAN